MVCFPDSRCQFFLQQGEAGGRMQVVVPTRAQAGLGGKETLAMYRPVIARNKSSFFRSFKSRSMSKRIRASIRRKIRKDPLTAEEVGSRNIINTSNV